jgi:hypothetical protein
MNIESNGVLAISSGTNLGAMLAQKTEKLRWLGAGWRRRKKRNPHWNVEARRFEPFGSAWLRH